MLPLLACPLPERWACGRLSLWVECLCWHHSRASSSQTTRVGGFVLWFNFTCTKGFERVDFLLLGCRAAWCRLLYNIILFTINSLSNYFLTNTGNADFLFCYIAETFYVVHIVLMEHGLFFKATYNTHFCVCILIGVNKTATSMLFFKLQTVVSHLS